MQPCWPFLCCGQPCWPFVLVYPLCCGNQSCCRVDDSCCCFILSAYHESKLPGCFCLFPSCSDHLHRPTCMLEVKLRYSHVGLFRGCILCAVVVTVAALLMTLVVVISFLLDTNQSYCLVIDSWHLACCIDVSCFYPFCRALLRGNVAKCELNLSLVMASLSAEIHFVQPDTISCSLGVCCVTSQLPRWKQRRDTTNHVGLLVVIFFLLTTNQSWCLVVRKVEARFRRRPFHRSTWWHQWHMTRYPLR